MDSDFPVSVEDARAALTSWRPDIDLLIGHRVGRAEGPRRELMSWAYNRLIRRMFDLQVRDVNFAFKLVRRSLLTQMRLHSEGSFVDAEILLEARRLGARLREFGMRYHPRTAGSSTAASTRVVAGILRELMQYGRRSAGWRGAARLIVNADDFGLCDAINQGVIAAFDHGIVTSASILPTGESFEQAVRLARDRPGLSVGVHLALTQTRPVLSPEAVPSLIDGGGSLPASWGEFLGRHIRGAIQRREVEAELRAQIENVLGAGLEVSHLDSHEHVHVAPGVLPMVARLAAEYGIGAVRCPGQRRHQAVDRPWMRSLRRRAQGLALRAACRLAPRVLRRHGLRWASDFRGFTEAGSWTSEALCRAIAKLDGGVAEICCHPGADDGVDAQLGWGYRWEQELGALTSDEVRAAVAENGVRLTSYREWELEGW
jgi:hopanoid biosynthesis associated protein HpnK